MNNHVLLSSISKGTEMVKKARDVMKDRNLQRPLLLAFKLAYIVVALVAARFFWGLHGLDMKQPLKFGSCNLITEAILALSICICLVQAIAHVIKGGPLLPESSRNRAILIIWYMALSLVIHGGSAATSGFQELLAEEVPDVKDDFREQLLLYSWWTSAASTIYGVVVYLTTSLAEPEPTIDLEEDPSPSKKISAWTLVPRLFQCPFALAGSLTMMSVDYDLYAFRFMVRVNFCSVIWNCLVAFPTIYSAWRSISFPSWVHTSIWFLDLVMLSVSFRGLFGAATMVYTMNFDLQDCSTLTCGTFARATALTLVSYICILLPTVLNAVKKVYGI